MAKVAAPEDRIVYWELATGKVRRSLKGQFSDRLTAFQWSPNGKLLATGHANHSVRVWEASSCKLRHVLRGPSAIIICLAWSRDSMLLAGGAINRQIHTWDATTGESGRVLGTQFRDPTLRLTFSPDGKQVAACGQAFDPTKTFDISSGRVGHILAKPRGRIFALAWSPDGKTLIGGDERGSLFRWDAVTSKPLPPLEGGNNVFVGPLSWAPDGKLLAGVQGSAVGVWNPHAGRFDRIAAQYPQACRVLAWSPDGQKMALLFGPAVDVVIHDAGSGKRLQTLVRGGYHALAVAWSPDSTRVASTAASRGQKLLIHNAATGKVLASSPAGQDVWATNVLAWSLDGKTLASDGSLGKTGGGGQLLLWNVTAKPLEARAFTGHGLAISALAWSPRGTILASGSEDHTIRLWKSSGESLGRLGRHAARITALRWLSEERLVSLDANGTVGFWDALQSRRERVVAGLWGGQAVSPDGRALAGHTGSAIRLWDLDPGRPIGTLTLLRSVPAPVWLALTPDGHYRGSPAIEREIVYVVQTETGQDTLTPADFAKKYGWKNEPERVQLSPK
jgi:WD40 repeat protein